MTRFRPGFLNRPNVGFFGVNFDGANDYLTRGEALTGVNDGKVGIVSFWFRMQGGDGDTQVIFTTETAAAPRLAMNRLSTNRLQLFGVSPASASVFQVQSATTYTASMTDYAHVLAAWDLGASRIQLYVDDGDVASVITNNDVVVDYTGNNFSMGGNIASSDEWDADVAEFYVNLAETLDISVEANRRKFINGDGSPRSLGATGASPTGNSPAVYLTGPASTWHINKGTGGGFTENGELTHVDFP